MAENTQNDDMLDALFDVAQQDTQQTVLDVPPALLGRVLEDAYSLQPASGPSVAPPQLRPKRRGMAWLNDILGDILGGWQPMAGLAAAAVAGVWIGFSAPTTLLPTTFASFSADSTDVYLADFNGGYAFLDEEG